MAAQIKFLALGDSYTIGEALPTEESWPWQLREALHNSEVEIAPPQIIAKTGWTTQNLLTELKNAMLSPPYQIVTLLIGVNNQYQHLSLEDYAADFKQLLAQAITLAGGNKEQVFVLSIPDWGVTPFAQAQGHSPEDISGKIKQFNQINARETYHQRVAYIHLTTLSQAVKSQPDLLAEDGLHYSSKMYRKWVDLLYPRIMKYLQTESQHIHLGYFKARL